MNVIYCLLLLAGVVCFFANSWSVRTNARELTNIGLGLVFLVPLIQYLNRLV